MARKLTLLFAVVVLMLSAVPAFGQDSLIESVCLVTDIGKINDGTFNQFAYEGFERAFKDFGLDNTFIETQAPTDYDTNMSRCIDDGYDAIITVGFLMTDATLKRAQETPGVYFIGVDQFVQNGPENYAGLIFREDQSGFLAGALAGQLTKSNVIAGIYGIDVPAVKKFRNGYEQGAKFVNPDVTALGVYIDSFTAPDRGAAAAGQFLGEGADVIFGAGGQTGSGGITRAAQEGALVIGVDQDEFFTTFGNGETPGAENLISSAVKRVDNAVYQAIEALVNGGEGWVGGSNIVMSADNDGIGFAPAHLAADKVPQAVIDRTNEILAGLKDGSIVTGVDPIGGDLLPTIAEIVVAQSSAAAPEFTTLLAAVQAAGLAETLTTGGPFTVFAPTDAAFAALPAGALDGLLADKDALTNVLLYHVVPGAVLAETVVGLSEATAAQGSPISIEVKDGSVVLNGSAKVVTTDILARNGVIHVIDAVILP